MRSVVKQLLSVEHLSTILIILDVKKMPLGKLSKQQIAKGFDVLVDLEKAVKAKKVSLHFHCHACIMRVTYKRLR